ncbi:acetate/propionate family kinase [Candidatus Saccharibacteria bacterium]|nr:acetate/propionate family kinase [Candidatus Saccharibacteria bacterium]
MNDKLILIVNPGSSSRKYALYEQGEILADLHFETKDTAIICNCKTNYCEEVFVGRVDSLSQTSVVVEDLLREVDALKDGQQIDAIAIRIVAPSNYFRHNQLVNDDLIKELQNVKDKAPLHVSVALDELKVLKSQFTAPIYAISDSAFHSLKPLKAELYAIDRDLADRFEIKRFGYHGLSVGSISHLMQSNNLKYGKTIVCHLGSDCSVSALKDGVSIDNSMGYTPLEGVAMATRSGNIDFSAGVAIKNALGISFEETEEYLNKNSGLLALSGVSGDLREVIKLAENGYSRAIEALDVYIYKIQQEIGKMAAALNGIDSIVFTATIGERSYYLRRRILANLNYLGLSLDEQKNEEGITSGKFQDISAVGSKPIYIIKADESSEIIRQVLELI